MFFSHMPELLVVLVVGLIVFGPKRLPEIGSSLGQAISELKNGVTGLHAEPAALVREPVADIEEATVSR